MQRVTVDEEKTATLPRPPMAEHTLAALCGGYVRYLARRTGQTEEFILDRFYCETGKNPSEDRAGFRYWAGKKVYMADQLRVDPFAGRGF